MNQFAYFVNIHTLDGLGLSSTLMRSSAQSAAGTFRYRSLLIAALITMQLESSPLRDATSTYATSNTLSLPSSHHLATKHGCSRVAVQIVESFAYGTANSSMQLAKLLADKGWRVVFFYGERVGTDAALKHVDARTELHRLPGKGPLKHVQNLRFLLKHIPADATIFHGHSSFGGAYARLLNMASGFKVTTLYSPRGYSFLRQDKSYLFRALFLAMEWTLGRVGTTIACGPAEYTVARRVSSRATKINNGGSAVEYTEQMPIEKVILGAGRICYQKGFDILKAIAYANPKVMFAWYGDVDPGAEQLAAGLPPNLQVHPPVDTNQLQSLIQASTAVCLPSRWEGLSRVLLDAIAQGKPLIVSDIPSNVDCLQRQSGSNNRFEYANGFACRTLDEYTTAITRLLESDELQQRQSAASKAYFQQEFELEKVGASWTDLYESFVGK